MTDNNTKVDQIHKNIPRFYNTRVNPNWKAVIEAMGNGDEELVQLLREVRKQFFVNSAARPYIDRLGANFNVSRPRFVGMDDDAFRDYIPVLAYQPKQVKLVLDLLLDIFFFKDATTAFVQSTIGQPFVLKDGWTLSYTVDGVYEEFITFTAADFVDIENATIDEVISAINRTATNSFAISFDDRINQVQYIRIFTNTIGSKGSVEITGGRANIAMQYQGFNTDAGSGATTIWNIAKVGDTVTFTHIGGDTPNLSFIAAGDTAVIDIPGNEGSFIITNVDVGAATFQFINLFATPMVFDHGANPGTSVSFMSPEKIVVFKRDTRAVVWEVTPGEIIVEMPASPPVVKRALFGSAHINGIVSPFIDRISDTSAELLEGDDWPTAGGQFVLQTVNEIQTHYVTVSEDTSDTTRQRTRFDKSQKYSYTSRVGNILSGITPNLPIGAGLFEPTILTANRDTADTVTVTTATDHEFTVGEGVAITDSIAAIDGDPAIDLTIPVNGNFIITSVPTTTTFTYISAGDEGESVGGTARLEKIGMANNGSLAYLTTSQLSTGVIGPYIWDQTAAFVLSSLTSTINQEIKAGNTVKTLPIATPNNIPDEEGFVIFDFGTENEEGPVRYLFKPTEGTMQMDPSYVFRNNHDSGSAITAIRRRGAHVMSGLGTEYAPYLTDPSIAREILQTLMLQVKSVGIFINFLVRYPEQVYAASDIYRSCSDTLEPINDAERARCAALL